jgi:hypothetical protein
MKIEKVTITGADNDVDPEALIQISQEFPEVEWGFVLSKKQESNPRYPSHSWLRKLLSAVEAAYLTGASSDGKYFFRACGHLCGSWMRDAMAGNWSVLDDRSDIIRIFDRFQLNLGEDSKRIDPTVFVRSLTRRALQHKSIILQWKLGLGSAGDHHIHKIITSPGTNVYPLFDSSGGQGIVPKHWPSQPTKVLNRGAASVTMKEMRGRGRQTPVFTGYAGGLSPYNLDAELRRIAAVADGCIWIDAETGVRDTRNKFSPEMAREFLSIARQFSV